MFGARRWCAGLAEPGAGMVGGGGGACKNQWRLARGKWFPARFLCVRWGEVYPASQKILKVDCGVRAAHGPGLRRRRCGVGAGLQPKGGHLVLLVADAQGEMVQG
jgi:hypothetical protein